MIPVLVMAAFFAAANPALETARDLQDRPALEKLAADSAAAADKAPNDADAQFRAAVAASYLAEVALEVKDKKLAEDAAERGIKPAERAVALKPDVAAYYVALGTLYGQVIPANLLASLSYGGSPRTRSRKPWRKTQAGGGLRSARRRRLLSARGAGRRFRAGHRRFPQVHRA